MSKFARFKAIASVVVPIMTICAASSFAEDLHPTWEWINVFCHEPTFNGNPLSPGDTVRAYDQSGTLCGRFVVRPDGGYGFMAVYLDDGWTPDLDEGAVHGEMIDFTLNGIEVNSYPEVYWTSFGDKWEACDFFICDTLKLHAGWNLVSWNLAYEASIGEFADLLGDSVLEVMYGFENGTLVYDPSLPEYSTLDSVDYRHGYWIRSNCEADIPICATRIDSSETIHLNTGWNLVPYWPEEPMSVEEALGTTSGEVETVVGFEDSALIWKYGMDAFNSMSELNPGRAYWVKSTQQAEFQFGGYMDAAPYSDNLSQSDQTTSLSWMMLYGHGLTMDGRAVADGSHIECKTEDGILCGNGTIKNGLLQVIPIYGRNSLDKASSSLPVEDEIIGIYVNGARTYPGIVWSAGAIKLSPQSLFTTPETAPVISPVAYDLSQNKPNPFNPSTEISFTLAEPGHVKLSVYNILGQSVSTLVDDDLIAGEHSCVWNVSDGGDAPSGVYFYRIQAGQFSETKKMVLLK